jgi:disulfide bond formation protein DsbB
VSTDLRGQSLREFRIETEATSKTQERLLLIAFMLSPIACVLVEWLVAVVFFPPRGSGAALRRLFPLALTGTLVVGYIVAIILAFLMGMRRAKRGMVFVQSDSALIRKRDGWPDDRIAFSQIAGLYETKNGLLIQGNETLTKMSVPRELNGFATIRAELARQHPVSAQANLPQPKVSWTRVVVMTVSMLSWSAVIFIFYEVLRGR